MNILKNNFKKKSPVRVITLLPVIMIVLMFTVGCGTSKKAARTHVNTDRKQYIDKYAGLAIEEMQRTGIPASIIMAQALLESDDGNSYLAVYGNNHFGVKCHKNWKGKKIHFDDDRRHECFRKYNSVEESYRDHSDFIRKGPRYAFLFSLKPEDYKAWAKGLKKAGYATNPHYAKMLIRIIEENKLYKLDEAGYMSSTRSTKKKKNNTEVGKKVNTDNNKVAVTANVPAPVMSDEFVIESPARKILINNGINYIIVKSGDTFRALNKELNMLPWELRKYNDLGKKAKLVPGQILYLQPKRKQAEAGKTIHVAKEGDTMYSISQQYGIKLKSLLEMNNMKPGEEPVPGQEIRLRR